MVWPLLAELRHYISNPGAGASNCHKESASGSRRESPNGFLPLLGPPFGGDEFSRPGERKVDRWPNQKRNRHPAIGFPNLVARQNSKCTSKVILKRVCLLEMG